MKKFYFVLSFFLALSGRQAASAQDSANCNASFQATGVDSAVTFRAMDSSASAHHNWNFGDGSGILSTSGLTVTHVYSAYGQYLVTQTVIDSANQCRDSASQFVTVSAPAPVCNVYITETIDSVHHTYTFIANVSVTPGATGTVKWMVNDTLAGTGDTLIRTLTSGPDSICALLTTNYSCQAQSCLAVNPQDSLPPPPDTCTIAFTAVRKDHKPNQYDFSVIDPERYNSISWTIMGPDSLFAGPYHGPGFSYTFPDTGYYNVFVTAEARSGCSVYNGQAIHIDSVPNGAGRYIESYPNPATTQVTLYLTLTSYSTINVRVYTSMGGLVLTRTVSGYPGVNQITLPIANLPTGVYYIELQYGDTILRSKVQKL